MTFVNRTVKAVFRLLPWNFWQSLENISHKNLGKGWGADSVSSEANAIKKLADRIGLTDFTCLDVGANIGTWSLEYHKQFPLAKIYCFEPSDAAFTILESATSHISQITLSDLAIGSDEGELTIYSNAPASGLTSLTKRRLEHFNIEMNMQEKVKVTTLDRWASINNVHPSVVKLDIEGHELDAFKGALQLLESVSIIQFEFGGANIDTRTYFQDFWYLLKPLKFDFYRLAAKGLMQIKHYTESDEVFLTTNYFAVRQ